MARTLTHLTNDLFSLGWAAPLVIGQRLQRMAAAGAQPDAADRREIQLMASEKVAAFGEAWWAMAMQTAVLQQSMTQAVWRMWWTPWAAPAPLPQLQRTWQRGVVGIVGSGVQPIRRHAVANMRRLAR